MGHLLGYARVSTTDQQPQLQVDALTAAGCYRVFTETASGARTDRPTLEQVLDQLRPGDTLVVWKLDRLGRSLRHLVDTVTSLADRGIGFRSLQEAIDTTTPGGKLVFHVFAALHGQRRLGRVATVGADGTPHVAPVGWTHNAALDTIDVTGHGLEQTKKFRDVERTGRAAIVIDDLASVSPWRPRAVEVRGRAEALRPPEVLIRIHPARIISWGLGPGRSARTVTRPATP
jgi:PPOX class F420-dependent enzyme/OxyR family protein